VILAFIVRQAGDPHPLTGLVLEVVRTFDLEMNDIWKGKRGRVRMRECLNEGMNCVSEGLCD